MHAIGVDKSMSKQAVILTFIDGRWIKNQSLKQRSRLPCGDTDDDSNDNNDSCVIHDMCFALIDKYTLSLADFGKMLSLCTILWLILITSE